MPDLPQPIGDQSKQLAGVKYECGHYFEWNRLFDLREREATTQTRALAHVQARRQLLDQALGWEHGLVRWDHNEVRACDSVIGKPCDCGRDERVGQVLQTLATPHREARRG